MPSHSAFCLRAAPNPTGFILSNLIFWISYRFHFKNRRSFLLTVRWVPFVTHPAPIFQLAVPPPPNASRIFIWFGVVLGEQNGSRGSIHFVHMQPPSFVLDLISIHFHGRLILDSTSPPPPTCTDYVRVAVGMTIPSCFSTHFDH